MDENTYLADDRNQLCMIINILPLDQNATIILTHGRGLSYFKFPAVVDSEGMSILRHSRLKTPGDHIAWQEKRRGQIIKRIKKIPKAYWE